MAKEPFIGLDCLDWQPGVKYGKSINEFVQKSLLSEVSDSFRNKIPRQYKDDSVLADTKAGL
jgi:hypothetical protein